MLRVLLASTSVLVLLAAPAFAVPATQAGADRIVQAFKALGAPTGLVTVTPKGDSYELALDAAPLFALAKASGATGSLNRQVMTLTDNGDGTWGVDWAQDLRFDLNVPGKIEMQFLQSGFHLAGTFDEKLMTLSESHTSTLSASSHQVQQDAVRGAITSDATFGPQTTTLQASANPAGGVDTSIHAEISAMHETVSQGGLGDTSAPPFVADIDKLTEDGSFKGLRNVELLKALAWAVPRWQDANTVAASAEGKAQIASILPIFDSLSAAVGISGMNVQTPVGKMALESGTFEITANGLVKDGLAREAITLSGLHLPPAILPAWILPVMPQTATIDAQVSDFDAAAWAEAALTWFDRPPEQQKDTPEWQDQMLAALLPDGTVTVTLNPGATTGKDYKLTYEGSLVAGPKTDIPTGQGKVTLTGMDALIEAMKSAPEDMRMQAMMGLGALRGMAKKGEDGALVWEIDGATPGKVLLNGMDLTKIGGGQ